MRHFIGFVVLGFVGLVVTACAGAPDPTAAFAMGLNGEKYSANLGAPRAFIQEFEAGFGTHLQYSVLFPATDRGAAVGSGLEITFDPARVKWGEAMPFGPAHDNGINVTFHPVRGHRLNEGQLLIFAAVTAESGGIIRFDKAESHVGGLVQGTVLSATLDGYYEDMMEGGVVEPETPLVLALWNFSFDTTLETWQR